MAAIAAEEPNVTLLSNVTLSEALVIDYDCTIDLNGYTIENRTAANTSGLSAPEVKDECIVFFIGEGGNLTLNATNGGKVIAKGDGANSYYNVAVWAAEGGKATINGGEYSNTADPEGDGCDLIYARGGEIYVTDGTFKAGAIRKTLGGGIYGVLNGKDNLGSKIYVSGGSFYEYGANEAAKVGNGEVVLLSNGYRWSDNKTNGYYSVVENK